MPADRRAVFLDRDGTILEDVGYLADPAGVALLPGAIAALRALRRRGFLLVLVSNQSGIGRGLITAAEADAVHRQLVADLNRGGVVLDDARYCPHAPNAGCTCRKPRPGLILASAEALAIDLGASFLVGNSAADVGAGEAAGVRTILLGADVGSWVGVVRAIDDWSRNGT